MNHEVLKRFIERVRQGSRGQTKQLIITMTEAQDIANALADLLLEQNELQAKIIKLQAENSVITVAVSGGSFS